MTINKELADITVDIVTFHQQYYIPTLARYTYHYGLVKMLSKKICYDVRSVAFMNAPYNVVTRRDYAEHISAQFNNEIQVIHFN